MAAKKETTEAKADAFDADADKRRKSKADMDSQARRIGREREAAMAQRQAAADGQIDNTAPSPRMKALLKDHQRMGAR